MRDTYFLIILIIGSLLLFVFVWPQAVNNGVDWINTNFSEKAKFTIPRIPERQFQLGLDLLGGAHLLYEADLSKEELDDKADAMNGIRDVIERRVNFFGVSEPLVQISGDDRLIIELAGISDVNQAIKLIEEFQKKELAGQATEFDSFLLNQQVFVATGLSGSHLKRAQLVFDSQTNQPQVSLELNDEGAKLFAEITKRNLGKRVAIFLDGLAISIPTVQSEITSGQAVISGSFTPQEAKLLATRLNSGALPVPITLISQQTIGASLGAASVVKSLKAGVWGLILVGAFMIFFYRLPGIVSVIALIVYVLIVLTIYKLVPVTLTLAGIAGFILSLGMAVDANVLIFARMREELKAGKTL